jgi:hypothetical protein
MVIAISIIGAKDVGPVKADINSQNIHTYRTYMTDNRVT